MENREAPGDAPRSGGVDLTYAFVCFFWGSLPGGHARFAARIARHLHHREAGRVRLVAVGPTVSERWAAESGGWARIHFERLRSMPGALLELRRVLCEADIVFAFDVVALFLARLAGLGRSAPVVAVVPGGKPPRRYPLARQIVVMSRELYDFFITEPRFRDSRIHLLENRIDLDALEAKAAESRPEWWPESAASLVRIGRLGPYYERSFRVAIGAVEALRSRGRDVGLTLIGVPEDHLLVNELRRRAAALNAASGRLVAAVIVDDSVTEEAAHQVRHGTVAVGAGDTALEALYYGIPTTIVGPHGGVRLVDDENFVSLSRCNFTGREFEPRPMSDDVHEMACQVERVLDSTAMRDAYGLMGPALVRPRFALEGAETVIGEAAAFALAEGGEWGLPDWRLVHPVVEWIRVCFARRLDGPSR